MAADRADGKGEAWNGLLGWMEKEGLPSAADLLGQKDWVENYVRRTLDNALPSVVSPLVGGSAPRPEVFDTHHFVIVKCALPKRMKEEDLRLYVRPDRVKISGWKGDARIVKLPALVDPYDCRALCRDGVLQIKIRKRELDRNYREVYIRYT